MKQEKSLHKLDRNGDFVVCLVLRVSILPDQKWRTYDEVNYSWMIGWIKANLRMTATFLCEKNSNLFVFDSLFYHGKAVKSVVINNTLPTVWLPKKLPKAAAWWHKHAPHATEGMQLHISLLWSMMEVLFRVKEQTLEGCKKNLANGS